MKDSFEGGGRGQQMVAAVRAGFDSQAVKLPGRGVVRLTREQIDYQQRSAIDGMPIDMYRAGSTNEETGCEVATQST